MKTITIPTKDNYEFMGYYSEPNGAGVRYFNHRGEPAGPYYHLTDKTLYAHWAQMKFNITFNKQYGSGGTDSIITTVDMSTDETKESTKGTLTEITPPTKAHNRFEGYYDAAAGTGTKYYNSDGTVTDASLRIPENKTLFAYWKQVQYPVTLDHQGGQNSISAIWTTGEDGTIPTVSIPTRTGYTFGGYFFGTGGTGDNYIDETGNGTEKKFIYPGKVLYAFWQPITFDITYILGDGATMSEMNISKRTYTQTLEISAPERSGYVFTGWSIDNGITRYLELTIPGKNPAYAKDITLTATWIQKKTTEVIEDASVTGTVGNADKIKEALGRVFDYLVTENDKGITVEDREGTKSITLKLTVNEIKDKNEATAIAEAAQGTPRKYYDLSVVKIVKTQEDVTERLPGTTTVLKELPVPIVIEIPITGDLTSSSNYSVYRVHDDGTESLSVSPERLPVGEQEGEYYEYTSEKIIISTRKFSTYGIVALESVTASKLDGDTGLPTEDFLGSNQNMDVQGRVIEPIRDKVYKIDIGWGSMKFEYSIASEWNPDSHMYTEGASNNWRESDFNGVNNRITAMNHSNGAVQVDFTVVGNITGTQLSLHDLNIIDSSKKSHILSAAPIGATDDKLAKCESFLFLQETPENAWMSNANNKTNPSKIGLITVTIQAYPDA